MSNNPYHPLTVSAYEEMHAVVNPIKAELPSDGHRLGIIWNNFKAVTGRNDAQPCGCKSTVKYWAEAIFTLKDFIISVELKQEGLSIPTNKPTE